MKIAIDFDGTCVTHEYPRIGSDIGAVPVLKQLAYDGNKLILNTMRSGKELDEAVAWFAEKDIPLYGINEDPGQKDWTESPKVFASLYIDDAGLGIPLVHTDKMKAAGKRPFVDWKKVSRLLSQMDKENREIKIIAAEGKKI